MEFWDGLNTLTGAAGLSHTLDILPGVFPAAALYTPRIQASAWGLSPCSFCPYLRSSVVSDDGRRAEFEYARGSSSIRERVSEVELFSLALTHGGVISGSCSTTR